MWYIIIFVLSVYSNSWAMWAMNDGVQAEMSTKDIQRKSKPGEIKEDDLQTYSPYLVAKGEKSITADGMLCIDAEHEKTWNSWSQGSKAAREYHLKMAQYYQILRDASARKEPEYSQYSEKYACHARLLKYLHEDNENRKNKITFARGANPRYCPSQWLYPFKNFLIAIESDTLKEARALSLNNPSDTFTAYSQDQLWALAADSTGKVRCWNIDRGSVDWLCQLPDTCKKVTAMHQVRTTSAVAIFYRDEKDNKKAGFLLSKNGRAYTFSVVPLAEKIEGITWRIDKHNKVCGSILGSTFPGYRLIAKYILHHSNYSDPEQYVEYILPNSSELKDNQ